jgi:hypothetical protein
MSPSTCVASLIASLVGEPLRVGYEKRHSITSAASCSASVSNPATVIVRLHSLIAGYEEVDQRRRLGATRSIDV